MYFRAFPAIHYSLDGGKTTFQVTDIFRRVRSFDSNLQTSTFYEEYDILEGETPEIVADKFYNESYYHWVVLLTNNIQDPRFDWPLGNQELVAYIKRKYDIENVDATKHFVNSDGDVVHSSYAGSKTPVSYFQYEEAINEGKRRINIIKPAYLSLYINTFTGLLNVN